MKKLFISLAAVLTLVASILPTVLARANDAGPLDSVTISPASALVAVNGTQQFTATGKDAANLTADNVTYTWSIIAGGGTINATSGLFTAGNYTGTFNGTVQVTAVQGNITKTANASVTLAVPGQLTSLAVSPAAVTIPVNGTQQFTAVAKDAFDQNATGVNLTWSVVAGGGTINSTSGLFTAGNATGTFNGTVQVAAVQGDIIRTANASVTVAAKSNDKKHTPPGWEHGKKKGWDDDDTPPGLARHNDEEDDDADEAEDSGHESDRGHDAGDANHGNTPPAARDDHRGKRGDD